MPSEELTYLGLPIFNTVWKRNTTTLMFTKKEGIINYRKGGERWTMWAVEDLAVLSLLQLHKYTPAHSVYLRHENPIINKIREMEARRKPLYTVENQHAQV